MQTQRIKIVLEFDSDETSRQQSQSQSKARGWGMCKIPVALALIVPICRRIKKLTLYMSTRVLSIPSPIPNTPIPGETKRKKPGYNASQHATGGRGLRRQKSDRTLRQLDRILFLRRRPLVERYLLDVNWFVFGLMCYLRYTGIAVVFRQSHVVLTVAR